MESNHNVYKDAGIDQGKTEGIKDIVRFSIRD